VICNNAKVAAKLKKTQLKKADKIPHTYDWHEFKLDGQIDLDINFNERKMNTAVYWMHMMRLCCLKECVAIPSLTVLAHNGDISTGVHNTTNWYSSNLNKR